MHPNSMNLMEAMKINHLGGDWSGSLLDVGSYDVNGTYRELFPGCEYVGIDTREGPGVDRVVDMCQGLSSVQMAGEHFDLVISGQMLEHCPHPTLAVSFMALTLKPGGFMFLIAPWQWPIHPHPKDYWRILPDGMRLLMEEAGLEVLECTTDSNDTYAVGVRRNGSGSAAT